jgi:RNA polymerase sigma-70 factor (ECF subfamily)
MDRVNVRSDEELMLAAGQGDLDAFERIVLRHQAEAWRVAYRFTGDAAEAEDLAQDAFLKILDAAPRYRPTTTFRTYFYRVLTRLCIDHRRKKRPVLANPFPNMPDTTPSPSAQAGQAERDALIQAALNCLPADYRMAVLLRYFEGLSGAEMAEAMGRSVKAVERLLARAKSALEPQLRHLLEP